MATRRPLDFRSYDELLADVARLRVGGYERAGNWALPQMLAHLARTIELIDDPTTRPMPRPAQWALRRVALPWLLRRRGMPAGAPMPKLMRTSAPATPEEADARFEAAIARARAKAGPTIVHPAFGTIPLDDWHQLQLIHAAHHLSFLVPRDV